VSKRRYFPNAELTAKGFNLSITSKGTVYHRSNRGMVKLDSFWQYGSGKIIVDLPNEESAVILLTKEGPKVEEEKTNE
jgi:hypothetical protein